MFVTNNHNWFHMFWKTNLLKHQKVSKHYDQDCLKNFILHFMPLLRALIILWLKFSLSFWKHVVDQTSTAFNTKFWPQWKNWKSGYQVKQFLSLLSKLVTIILD